MKHEVDSWVQALPASHRDRPEPPSMPTNTVPPADSPSTPHSAGTHAPVPPIQPSTAATEVVCNEVPHPEATTIGQATANPSWHQPRPPKAFPLPSTDGARTLDRRAPEGRPSPYLIRRCPVCFSASGGKLVHSRYVTVRILAVAYQKITVRVPSSVWTRTFLNVVVTRNTRIQRFCTQTRIGSLQKTSRKWRLKLKPSALAPSDSPQKAYAHQQRCTISPIRFTTIVKRLLLPPKIFPRQATRYSRTPRSWHLSVGTITPCCW